MTVVKEGLAKGIVILMSIIRDSATMLCTANGGPLR